MIKHCLKIIIPIFLFFVLLSGCSYTYDQGVQLESEERWAEAEIEYRKAYIEDPDDEEIKTALARVRQKTSAENFQVYQDYLAEKKFRKAYRRLESALSQNPNLIEAQAELKHWRHLLITGKVEFEFDRFGSNIQLAEEMHLEIRINAPNQKILTGIISGESGVFFIEDLVYQANISDLASYSINSIGLKIKRRNSQGFQQSEFKKFINFRDLKPFQISGKLQTDNGRNPINLLESFYKMVLEEEGTGLISSDAFDELRVLNGIPRMHQDYGSNNFPQEAALGDHISYNKGCYVGQEPHSRMLHRGHPNWMLVWVRIPESENISSGMKLYQQAEEKGEITSIGRIASDGYFFGIAMVRFEVSQQRSPLSTSPEAEPVVELNFLPNTIGLK